MQSKKIQWSIENIVKITMKRLKMNQIPVLNNP